MTCMRLSLLAVLALFGSVVAEPLAACCMGGGAPKVSVPTPSIRPSIPRVDTSSAVNSATRAGKDAVTAGKNNMDKPGGTGAGSGAAETAASGSVPGKYGVWVNTALGAGAPNPTAGKKEPLILKDTDAADVVTIIGITAGMDVALHEQSSKSGSKPSSGKTPGAVKGSNPTATSSPAASPAPVASPTAGNPIDPNAGAKIAALQEQAAAQAENRRLQDELKRANDQQRRLDNGTPSEQDLKEASEKYPGKDPKAALADLKWDNGQKIVTEINPKIGKNGERIKTAENNVKTIQPGRNYDH